MGNIRHICHWEMEAKTSARSVNLFGLIREIGPNTHLEWTVGQVATFKICRPCFRASLGLRGPKSATVPGAEAKTTRLGHPRLYVLFLRPRRPLSAGK
jgi:hypothetical protein